MAKALEEQMQMPDLHDLAFEERLGLLIDREETERENRRLQTRRRRAKLTQSACVEDIDWKPKRGLQKTMLLQLSSCAWIASHLNLIVTGPRESAKPISPVRWRKKPVRKDTALSLIVCPGCFRHSASPKETGVMANSCCGWRKPICLYWMIGDSLLLRMRTAGTCWKYWKTGIAKNPHW